MTARERAEAYLGGRGMFASPADVGALTRAFREAITSAQRDERERCAKEAESGGCSCAFAPCDHDDTGKALASKIRRLSDEGTTP